MRAALSMFDRWREFRKVTVFGSARTPVDSPLYALAHEFSSVMAGHGWMTITGGGPGIMEASSAGAGRAAALGVNIELPFEHGTNPYVDLETMHVAMSHFFSRKFIMTRDAHAFVAFPGGVGTMDELFEILTLLFTGKTDPAPVVLIDVPDGTFWQRWSTFMDESVIGEGYLSGGDQIAYVVCDTVDAAVAEILHFHANFVAYDLRGGWAHLTVRTAPTTEQAAALGDLAPGLTCEPGEHGVVLRFRFEGRSYARLRHVINCANDWVDPPPTR